MGSSKQQAGDAAELAAGTGTLTGSRLMQDSRLQAALLCHPAIVGNQQVVLALLQASKQLHQVVAEWCAGRMLAVLHAPFSGFAQWLPKHCGLLKELKVQLGESICKDNWEYHDKQSEAVVEALATAFDQQQPQLQALSLRGGPAGPILHHLPAAHLTRLCASIDFEHSKYADCRYSNSKAALARMTGLRSLDLCDSDASLLGQPSDNALEPISGMHQLTELCLGKVTPLHLLRLQLPTLLRHVDMIVALEFEPTYLTLLASWLQQHGSLVRRLEIVSFQTGGHNDQWAAAVQHLAAALKAAGSTPPAGSPAAAAEAEPAAAVGATASLTSPAASVGVGLQLQSVVIEKYQQIGPVLQCLPASRLTHLQCALDYSSAPQWAALRVLTALRSLSLNTMWPLQTAHDYWDESFFNRKHHVHLVEQPSGVLAQLSALKQLTQLRLEQARLKQLQRLPAWLLALEVSWRPDRTKQLQLGHLTALSALSYLEYHDELRQGDVLPPNLRVLEWPRCGSVQPLLALSRLEFLRVRDEVGGVAATELQQLSNLRHLRNVQLQECCE